MYCTELWSSKIIHLTREWIFEECNNNIHVTMRTSVNEFGEHTHSFKSWSRTVEGCWNYCSMQNVQRFRSSHIPKKCNLYQFRANVNSTCKYLSQSFCTTHLPNKTLDFRAKNINVYTCQILTNEIFLVMLLRKKIQFLWRKLNPSINLKNYTNTAPSIYNKCTKKTCSIQVMDTTCIIKFP